ERGRRAFPRVPTVRRRVRNSDSAPHHRPSRGAAERARRGAPAPAADRGAGDPRRAVRGVRAGPLARTEAVPTGRLIGCRTTVVWQPAVVRKTIIYLPKD